MHNIRLLRQEQILKDWWSEVNENFWAQDARRQVKTLVKSLLEDTLEQDLELKRHDSEDLCYRNGYYARALQTQFGLIDDLQVPRLRDKTFKTRVFQRYKRFQPQVEDLLQDCFLKGVSTRKIGGLVCQLLETKVSSSKVSTICRRLDVKVQAHHQRSLIDEYQYLVCDGITLKVRYNAKYYKRLVLVVYGITLFGKRELIDFRQAKGESQNAWESLLNSLYHRGLLGKHLKLIVMDGSAGLKAAAGLIYPHAKIQRCWAHKLRNVSQYCKKKYEKECLNQAKKIYLAKNKKQALKQFKDWKAAWRRLCPKAVWCLEENLEELLPFLDCPKDHQIKVRTTNVIERSFREVRRRTRVFSCFSNLQSSERIIYAIFNDLNNRWMADPLKQFTQFN